MLAVSRLLLIWLLIILLGLELSLRALGFSYYWAFARYPDHYRGYALMPGADARQDLEGHARIRINGYGFRDRNWTEKPAGVHRVAVLGDSFTAAVQVPLEDTWWRQLEIRLRACGYRDRPVEIMNFSVSGYGTAQQLETLRHHLAPHQPDEVWVTFFPGNDITDNHPLLSDDPLRPYLRSAPGDTQDDWQMDYTFRALAEYRHKTSRWGAFYYRYLLRLRSVQALALVNGYINSKLALARVDRTWVWEPGIDARVYAPPQSPEWEEAWEITRTLVRMIRDETRALGASLRVLGLSTGAQVYPADEPVTAMIQRLNVPDLLYPNWLMGQFAGEDGYDFIDLAGPMAQQARETGVFFHGLVKKQHGQGHWNQAGHTAAAEQLAERLCADNGRENTAPDE
jgi:lysophospholipase L1-like esterase